MHRIKVVLVCQTTLHAPAAPQFYAFGHAGMNEAMDWISSTQLASRECREAVAAPGSQAGSANAKVGLASAK
jgi:hypothetical protein